MNAGDLVTFKYDIDDNFMGLVIAVKRQAGGHDYPRALVLWQDHDKPFWEKTEILLRINEVKN